MKILLDTEFFEKEKFPKPRTPEQRAWNECLEYMRILALKAATEDIAEEIGSAAKVG